MPHLIYLASPYSHPDPLVREQRFKDACVKAGNLMRAGYIVISPIAHSHNIASLCQFDKQWQFWSKQDLEILSRCDEMFVLRLDGWQKSEGIKAEIEFAYDMGIPIRYIDP